MIDNKMQEIWDMIQTLKNDLKAIEKVESIVEWKNGVSEETQSTPDKIYDLWWRKLVDHGEQGREKMKCEYCGVGIQYSNTNVHQHCKKVWMRGKNIVIEYLQQKCPMCDNKINTVTNDSFLMSKAGKNIMLYCSWDCIELFLGVDN